MKKLFLILSLTLFLYSFYSINVHAATLNTTANVSYSIENLKLRTDINLTFKNQSNFSSVLNYYSITLPYQGISDVKVKTQSSKLNFTTQKQKNGLNVLINTDNRVILPKSEYRVTISFLSLSTVSKDWSYAKIRGKITGLDINKITVFVPSLVSEVGFVEGAKSYTETISKNGKSIVLSDITQSNISILFGKTVTYSYSLSKNVLNNTTETLIYELPLPTNYNKQKFIISSISPKPVSSKLDSDGNVLLKFLIEPEKQEVINITGYISKIDSEGQEQENYLSTTTQNIGYWNLTNQFEQNRLSDYLKTVSKNNYPENLLNYIVGRLEINKGGLEVTSSFENSLRGGADVAIGRSNNSVPEDYNDLLITILRQNSIPARLVSGFIPSSSSYSDTGFFHSWVEYYDLDKKKWITLDPSLKDTLKLKTEYTSSPNYIALIVRGTNPLNPKLPYLENKDISILPSNYVVQPVFEPIQTDEGIKNNGNIPIIISKNGTQTILLPDETFSVSEGNLKISSLDNEEKYFEYKDSNMVSVDKVNYFYESLIFFIFSASLFLINSIFSKIKKLWK